MRMPFSSKWASLALLSVIVPVSLLATFRLTGVLPEPLKPETITVETVNWNMSRPSKYVSIDEWIENSFSDSITSIGLRLHVSSYAENSIAHGDYLFFGIFVTGNVTEGFVQSVLIKFSLVDTNAFLDIVADLKDPDWVELHNLTIQAVRDSWRTNEPYIDAIAPNHTKNCSLKMRAYWQFFDENTVNHWIMVTLEITYFTGTTYRIVAIPIQLAVMTS